MKRKTNKGLAGILSKFTLQIIASYASQNLIYNIIKYNKNYNLF